jgi:hypothetical protein
MLPEHLGLLFLALVVLTKLRIGRAVPLRLGAAIGWGAGLLTAWWAISFAISMLSALQPAQSVRLLTWILANIIAAGAVCLLRTPVASLIRVGLATATVVAVVDLIGWALSSKAGVLSIFTEQDYASGGFRLQGLGSEPNVMAAYFVLWLCIAYAGSHHLPAGLVWVFTALAGVSVYLTYTRISWLLFAFVALALALKRLRGSRFFLTFLVLALAMGVGLVAYVLSLADAPSGGSGAAALLARLNSLQNLDSGTGALRLSTAAVAVQDLDWHRQWLTGFGYNAYPQLHDTGVTSYATPYLALLWLALFYDSGFVGAVPFLLGFLLLWFGTRRVGSAWFFLAFALISTTTNIIWFAFPWVLGALLVRLAGERPPP